MDNKFDWHNYNESQTREKSLFVRLLKDICLLVEEPTHQKGRKRKPLKDVVYAICLRAYNNTSTRRIQSDLKMARQIGYTDSDIPFNTLLDHLERRDLTYTLTRLVEISALPLHQVELDFAIDSTGFSTVNHVRYYDYRHKKDKRVGKWRKCHLICGVKTNIVTSVILSEGNSHDTNYFKDLAHSTGRNFKIREISADKGYVSKSNYNCVRDLGGVAYILFKKGWNNGQGKGGGDSFTWRTMFRFFRDHQEEFLEHYHKRSNVESTISMIKRKFGNSVKCKKIPSQDNEILAKVLVHNICVLIQEIFLNNIAIDFIKAKRRYISS
ncbi:MAG: transposase [Nanoarchaeota archaeon]